MCVCVCINQQINMIKDGTSGVLSSIDIVLIISIFTRGSWIFLHNCKGISKKLITFTFSHFADLKMVNTSSESLKRGKQTQEVLVIQSFRHCSNKLARKGNK